MAQNPPKSAKFFKPKAIPSFLEDIGLIKVEFEFSFGYLKCHFFIPEYVPFYQKCPSLRAQKCLFGYSNENSNTTFISQTSPKNDGIAFTFFGWVLSHFLKNVFSLVFYIISQKNKDHVFLISFRPNSNGKSV